MKLFLVRHIRAAVSEIHKRLLKLDLFRILLHPHLTPPTSHHPVLSFYSHWQASTYLSTIFYISPVLLLKKFSPHSIISTSAALFFTPSPPNSSLLCFTHPLCSLHDFPQPCHSSWFGSIRRQEVCDFVCVEESESEEEMTTWGYCSDPYFISQRSGWEGALKSFLSFLPVTLKLLCSCIQAQQKH